MIVTTDDLTPDIGMQGISQSAARGANGNDDNAAGYEKDENQKIPTCVAQCKVLCTTEPSISMEKAKVPFKHSIDLSDLITFVPYELSFKLPPHVKILTCKAHKAKSSYEQCNVNLHGVDIVTMDDLSPEIDNLEIFGYQDEVNVDGGDAGNLVTRSGAPQKVILSDKFDLCIATCDLKTIVDELRQKHGYKLRGAGLL